MTLFIFLSFVSVHSLAGHVHIAVSSNFTHTMRALVSEFEVNTTHSVNVSFASSGKIYAQIMHGAPFDLFFSADQDKPLQLEKNKQTVVGTRFSYAEGQLALWSLRQGLVNGNSEVLLSGQFNKVAMANPKLAPYGLAAKQVLDKLKLEQELHGKKVFGENISQVFQFVRSENIDLGFVAWSQITMLSIPAQGDYWLVPKDMHQPILQDLVMLKRAKNNQAALAFLEFIQQPKAKSIIRKHGYLVEPVNEINSFEESPL